MGEKATRALLAVGGVGPFQIKKLALRAHDVFESGQNRLSRVERIAAQDEALHDGGDDLVRVHRHGHGNAKRPADVLVLSEEDFEHDAVNLVVHAVVGDDLDVRAALAEAVHAAFALFVACGIPREVVVEYRIEIILEVDAFGEAVGANEHALFCLAEGLNAHFALCGRQCAGDRVHGHFVAKLSAQPLRDVIRRGDESAEDDGVVAFLDQSLDELDGLG